MSDPHNQPTSKQPQDDLIAAGAPGLAAQGPVGTPAEAGVDEPNATGDTTSGFGDTAGTGTIVALGCIGATVFLIVIGLLYLGATQLFG